MANLTSVGDSVSLQMSHKGDKADVALSGTYDMTVVLQREVGSPGSGAWDTIKTWDTADATVAYSHITTKDNESLRVIVTVDTSGTCVATLTDTTDALLQTVKDALGNVVMKQYQDGIIYYNSAGEVILDTRRDQQIVALSDADATISAANSGKVHTIANVSADRTFTLPPAEAGLSYRFVAEVGAADGHDWIFVADATADLFKGGLIVIDTDAGPAVASAVVADQADDDQLQVNVPQGGTVIDMYCDGTYWIVSGTVLATAVPAFS